MAINWLIDLTVVALVFGFTVDSGWIIAAIYDISS